jgi:hypothetical protein
MSGNISTHMQAMLLAAKDYLNAMLAEPFDEFTFSPAGASVCQLGNFGTAAKKLKTLDLRR